MRQSDFWKLSFCNIFSTPTRSFLTVLGMAIGIGAILTVLTLGNAGKVQVESEMTRLGIDKIWLTASPPQAFYYGDGALIAENLQTTVTEQVYAPICVSHWDFSCDTMILGCDSLYMESMNTNILEGRMLYPLEWQNGSRSILMGETLAETLHITVGNTITILGRLFECVGILSTDIALSQVNASNAIVLPVAVFCELMGNQIHEVMVSVPDSYSPNHLANETIQFLQDVKQMDASATTMQVQIDAANNVIQVFVDVLKWVAVVCTLVGGIGVMNILLVSVKERRREIGIMQSLGTTPAQISELFLLESIVYAIVGGLLGILIGGALIEVAGKAIGLTATVQMGDCILVLLVATIIGLFFGVFPAKRASMLKPVDALKQS